MDSTLGSLSGTVRLDESLALGCSDCGGGIRFLAHSALHGDVALWQVGLLAVNQEGLVCAFFFFDSFKPFS